MTTEHVPDSYESEFAVPTYTDCAFAIDPAGNRVRYIILEGEDDIAEFEISPRAFHDCEALGDKPYQWNGA